jgi:hypothetical protein
MRRPEARMELDGVQSPDGARGGEGGWGDGADHVNKAQNYKHQITNKLKYQMKKIQNSVF